MKDTSRTDDWGSLCEQASRESDPQKLMELITKIKRALEDRHQPSRVDEALFKVDPIAAYQQEHPI